ncbi:MarR family transcriptional regulator [Herbiconiux moechotypicola]|uniref:HTH marR-type domain-containing protein n=1 Tax=Herbiconiux moechotypicola TaxID=637393 RepID=A0ABP5Q2Y6_9MICO|nr:MarR family transcriptional regulator [Herbiconiux moechotypicola]MCS5728146.1 MarR family transcriptional regulator [Herbiconiux moechotypicola]
MENSRDAGRKGGRLSPTPHDLRVWRDFVETGNRIRSLLEARLQAESGMSSGDYSVLLALSEAPGKRMRSSELAEAIGWERSRLSHHLGRMERRGLVGRSSSEVDGRGAEVLLTEEGASRFRVASVAHLRAVQELFVEAFAGDGGRGGAASAERAEVPPGSDARQNPTLTDVEGVTTVLTRHLDSLLEE